MFIEEPTWTHFLSNSGHFHPFQPFVIHFCRSLSCCCRCCRFFEMPTLTSCYLVFIPSFSRANNEGSSVRYSRTQSSPRLHSSLRSEENKKSSTRKAFCRERDLLSVFWFCCPKGARPRRRSARPANRMRNGRARWAWCRTRCAASSTATSSCCPPPRPSSTARPAPHWSVPNTHQQKKTLLSHLLSCRRAVLLYIARILTSMSNFFFIETILLEMAPVICGRNCGCKTFLFRFFLISGMGNELGHKKSKPTNDRPYKLERPSTSTFFLCNKSSFAAQNPKITWQ